MQCSGLFLQSASTNYGTQTRFLKSSFKVTGEGHNLRVSRISSLLKCVAKSELGASTLTKAVLSITSPDDQNRYHTLFAAQFRKAGLVGCDDDTTQLFACQHLAHCIWLCDEESTTTKSHGCFTFLQTLGTWSICGKEEFAQQSFTWWIYYILSFDSFVFFLPWSAPT